MKWMKSLISVMGAITLLAVSTVGATAQAEEADLSTPAYVTWTAGDPTSVIDGDFDEETGEMRGLRLEGIPLEASDPRLSGIATMVINGNVENSADHNAVLESRSFRIVNDEGAWNGSSWYVEAGDTSGDEYAPLIISETSLMIGEGAYEGLVAVVVGDYLENGSEGEAVIYAFSAPPVPEIPDAAAK